MNGTRDDIATLSYRSGMRSSQVRHEIFVSHQRQDVETARQLAILLSRKGYLRQMIGNGQALLAVVSRNTVASWWVPMEIGVALDREKHIGTYLVNRIELPSYLWLWPVMDSFGEAATWANHANGHLCYMDDLDPQVDGDSPGLERSQPEAYHQVWRDLSFRRKSVSNITVR